MTPLQLKKLVTKVLDEHKAEEIVAINISKLTAVADYMIICSATSPRHIKALANHLITTCKEHDIRPLGAEGIDGTHEWALIDLGYAIVHIMSTTMREFYSLEKLWQVSTAKEQGSTAKEIKPRKQKQPSKDTTRRTLPSSKKKR